MIIDSLEGGTFVKASWLCGLQSRKASWAVAKRWQRGDEEVAKCGNKGERLAKLVSASTVFILPVSGLTIITLGVPFVSCDQDVQVR